MINDILKDAQEMQNNIPQDTILLSVSQLCAEMQTIEADIERYKELVSKKQEELLRVSTQQLPELLRQFGMSEIKLTDGSKVTMSKKYFAAITEEKREAAYDWLKENDCGHIIKEKLEIPFEKCKKGESNAEYENLKEVLDEAGVSYVEKGDIPWQTLRAFAKEQMEDSEKSEEFPKELFGVFTQDVVQIKKG